MLAPLGEPKPRPLDRPGATSVQLLDQRTGAVVNVPLGCTVQDYICRPPAEPEVGPPSARVRLYRLRAERGGTAFSFTICCPLHLWRGNTVNSLSCLRVLAGRDGGNYVLWLWGTRLLYIAEMGLGNDESELTREYTAAVAHHSAAGVPTRQADRNLPFTGRSPAGVIDLRGVLPKEDAGRNSTARGAVVLLPFEIAGSELDGLTLKAAGGSKQKTFTLKGKGRQWRLAGTEPYDAAVVWGTNSGAKDGNFGDPKGISFTIE